jgi:hypothetical protein
MSPGWESLQQRFFAPDYQSYDHENSVSNSVSEKIISSTKSDSGFEVVTTGFAGGRWRFRYRLAAVSDEWLIEKIEWECWICNGTGKRRDGTSPCKPCDGVGWKFIGGKRNGSQTGESVQRDD